VHAVRLLGNDGRRVRGPAAGSAGRRLPAVDQHAGNAARDHVGALPRRPQRVVCRGPALLRQQRALHQVRLPPPNVCRRQRGPQCAHAGTFRSFPPLERGLRYGGYSYLTVLLLSLFLGVLGVDRLCLQWNCMGAAKLLTLGGIGVWWLVDLILLTIGQMVPADGSLWNPSW